MNTATGAVVEKILYSFQQNGVDGSFPMGLIQGKDGNLYGTTQYGGGGNCTGGCGTVFRISLNPATGVATETVLHAFQNDGHDGVLPLAGVIQGSDGDLYGTTSQGGLIGWGTVFRISVNAATGKATERVLHAFGNLVADGAYPYSGLVQGSDGVFYGTTFGGGNDGCPIQISGTFDNGCGTVFSVSINAATNAVEEKVLYYFQADGLDGLNPQASLIQGSDGSFYGTTSQGGTGSCLGFEGDPIGCGTVFKIVP